MFALVNATLNVCARQCYAQRHYIQCYAQCYIQSSSHNTNLRKFTTVVANTMLEQCYVGISIGKTINEECLTLV